MAIWQVACVLVNKTRKLSCYDSRFNSSLHELERVFPEEKSWSEHIKQYGKSDSTCIEIYWRNNEIEEGIDLRIDLRNILKWQLQTICEFAKTNDLYVEYENVLYEPNMESFIEIINKSNACKFLHNPKDFLTALPINNQSGDGSKPLKKSK